MKKKLLGLYFSLFFLNAFSQEKVDNSTKTDSIVNDKKLKVKLDVLSRYIWRGQSWGGDYVVFQPTIEYKFNKKILLGFWGTSNFKKDYFYADGSSYKGYQEINVYASYALTNFITVQLWDYYWPSVEKIAGKDNGFFNYGTNSVKTLDFIVLFDFSDFGLPLNATISSLIAGNDYRFDSNGENPKQNYTTYAEIGYTIEDVLSKITAKAFQDIQLASSVGMVFNNQAEYYAAGDYNKPSLVNLSLKASKEYWLSKNFSMPVSLTYTHNAARKNTETFGRNFIILSAGLTF